MAMKRKIFDMETSQNKRLKVAESDEPVSESKKVLQGLKRLLENAGRSALNAIRKRKHDELASRDEEASSAHTGSSSIIKTFDGCGKNMEEGPTKKRPKTTGLTTMDQKAAFMAKYKKKTKLGEGGYGLVFKGRRRADNFPVAIKYVPREDVCKETDQNGNEVPAEVAVMTKMTTGQAGSEGASGSVALLDFYELDQELILVMERPIPCEDLLHHTERHGGLLHEDHAKVILKQLLLAAAELEHHGVFHRDIKQENILIQSGRDGLRVRLIDFGMSCFTEPWSCYRTFYGTTIYTPPEFFSRSVYKAGPTTVWQLGTVLFELLHKDTVFETPQFLTRTLRISKNLSGDCRNFLKKCLEIIPERRSTVQQLLLHPWFD